MPATISEVDAMLFSPNRRKLDLISEALRSHASVAEIESAELEKVLSTLQRRPLVRFFVMRAIEQEMSAAGVNWDAIGDFLLKIAPLIFELIKMFM